MNKDDILVILNSSKSIYIPFSKFKNTKRSASTYSDDQKYLQRNII